MSDTRQATVANNAALLKPIFRPNRCINPVAGSVPSAVPATVNDMGSVDSADVGASLDPIMPPIVTVIAEPDTKII